MGGFLAVIAILGLATQRRWVLAGLVGVAVVAGGAAADRSPDPPDQASRRVAMTLVAQSDPVPTSWGWAFVATGPNLAGSVAVRAPTVPALMVGDAVHVTGSLGFGSSRLHRRPLIGSITASDVLVKHRAEGVLGLANVVRGRVAELFPTNRPEAALMRGFLVGDTSAMSDLEVEEMRRAGLVHFVAVSGGNVALFLAVVWLLLGAFPLGPRTRAAIGLGAVFVFVLITRWEPSVVRAGLMMGLVLGGRLAGVPVRGWTALGAAVSLALVVAPGLVFDVGFQLSVLATSGLLLGSGVWSRRRPQWLWRALAATVAAQLAVTPLLLVVFGTVPAAAAIANVLAAPVVSAATALGWAATVSNLRLVANLAATVAGVVLTLARWASELPQVGVGGSLAIAATVWLTGRNPRWAVGIVVMALAVMAAPVRPISGPAVTFLDVGQGDAAVIHATTGEVVVVDAGPDPVALRDGLIRAGVSAIDLLILTHSDGDHVGGLPALPGRVHVDEVWRPAYTEDQRWHDILGDLSVPARAVSRGDLAVVGDIRIEVLGPRRRYAGDNDGSVALWIELGGASVLMAGDVEAVAQAELPAVRPDVLLVPHHGSATTDPVWLSRTMGPVAVLSYGLGNRFGHPAQEILATLGEAAITVFHTANGDVTIRLDRIPEQASSRAAPARSRRSRLI